MKLTKILFALIMLAVFGSCKDEFVDNTNSRHIVITAELPDDNLTRASLTQKDGSLDMIAHLDEGDELSLAVEQDGKLYQINGPTFFNRVPVSKLSDNRKTCTFEFDLREEVNPNRPYNLYGANGMMGIMIGDLDGREVGLAYGSFGRSAGTGIPLYFKLESGKDVKTAKFRHLTAYEVLHVTNTDNTPLYFQFGGFEAADKWYYMTYSIYFPDCSIHGDDNKVWNGYGPEETINPGETKIFLSCYVPTGKKMSNAKLRAIVNGNEITSSNTKSSDVNIEIGKAYHMYVSWDGKDLKFGKDEPQQQQREAVDLGLPSGTRWATCNVGANSPEEYGEYYAWGETEEKDDYSWKSYKWCNGSSKSITKYCKSVDNKHILDLEDDVAHVKWGGNWRMPTMDECNELEKKCKSRRTTVNGVEGQEIIGPNGNSIFLPAAGRRNNTGFNYVGNYPLYWSSSGLSDSWAHSLRFPYYSYEYSGNWERHYGYPVRPVIK